MLLVLVVVLVVVLVSCGEIKKAVAVKSSKVDNTEEKNNYNLALDMLDDGDFKGAAEAFAKLAKNKPESVRYKKFAADAYLFCANEHYEADNHCKEAYEMYKLSLENYEKADDLINGLLSENDQKNMDLSVEEYDLLYDKISFVTERMDECSFVEILDVSYGEIVDGKTEVEVEFNYATPKDKIYVVAISSNNIGSNNFSVLEEIEVNEVGKETVAFSVNPYRWPNKGYVIKVELFDKADEENIISLDINEYEINDEAIPAIKPDFENGIYVVDAVNYTKPVTDPGSGVLSVFPMHKIVIPKIVGENPAVKYFNDYVYSCYNDYYDKLVNNEEGRFLYDISYEYQVKDGLVAIYIRNITGKQNSDYWEGGKNFYFDTKTYSTITFDEYLSSLGLTYEQAIEKINLQMRINNIYFSEERQENNYEAMKFYSLTGKDGIHPMTSAVFGDEKSIVHYKGENVFGNTINTLQLGSIFN